MKTPKWLQKLKDDPRVYDVVKDDDGSLWVYLKAGNSNPSMGNHIIHEDSREEVMADFKRIEPCDPTYCDCHINGVGYIDPAEFSELKEYGTKMARLERKH